MPPIMKQHLFGVANHEFAAMPEAAQSIAPDGKAQHLDEIGGGGFNQLPATIHGIQSFIRLTQGLLVSPLLDMYPRHRR